MISIPVFKLIHCRLRSINIKEIAQNAFSAKTFNNIVSPIDNLARFLKKCIKLEPLPKQ